MNISRISTRLRQIHRYTGQAKWPLEKIRLAALGVARGHPFSAPGALSAVGRTIWPRIVVRPSRFKGLAAELDPGELGQMIIFDEVVFAESYDLSLVPFVPDQVYDCGGHIGLFSLLASGTYPAVPLSVFEPNPRNAQCIRRQKELNRLPFTLVEAAVSTQAGEAVFVDAASFSGALDDGTRPPSDADKGRYTVKVVNFPEIVRARAAERLLLKIDIEGEEVRLIPALFDILPRNCAIFFETHAFEAGWEQMADSLRARDFNVQRQHGFDECVVGFALRTGETPAGH